MTDRIVDPDFPQTAPIGARPPSAGAAKGAATGAAEAPSPLATFIRAASRSAWTLVVLIPILVAVFKPEDVWEVVRFALGALVSTAPYIATAVFMVAYLKASGAEKLVARAFQGREASAILLAALVGGLAPFCSCEVIPFIAGLLALGAPLSAVMAFWLSSPLIDPPQAIITASALGWEFAVGKAISAVALGILGGFVVKMLIGLPAFANPLKERRAGGCCSKQRSLSSERPVWRFWGEPERRAIFREELIANAFFLLKWLSLAYMLEALLVNYVAAETIGAYVGGDGFSSIAIGALIGAPAYLNGYAAPAMVSGLMEQGMSAGAAMAFMVAGAVSSIPAMAAVFSLVRPPVFIAYLALGIGGAMVVGAAFGAVV